MCRGDDNKLTVGVRRFAEQTGVLGLAVFGQKPRRECAFAQCQVDTLPALSFLQSEFFLWTLLFR